MAQDRNTFAKRQRETAKKRKAEDKRARRRTRKEHAASGTFAPDDNAAAQEPGESTQS